MNLLLRDRSGGDRSQFSCAVRTECMTWRVTRPLGLALAAPRRSMMERQCHFASSPSSPGQRNAELNQKVKSVTNCLVGGDNGGDFAGLAMAQQVPVP